LEPLLATVMTAGRFRRELTVGALQAIHDKIRLLEILEEVVDLHGHGMVVSPLEGLDFLVGWNPGRCPALVCVALLELLRWL
jgi:hypothetical protein